jgi:hypothetical protein
MREPFKFHVDFGIYRFLFDGFDENWQNGTPARVAMKTLVASLRVLAVGVTPFAD